MKYGVDGMVTMGWLQWTLFYSTFIVSKNKDGTTQKSLCSPILKYYYFVNRCQISRTQSTNEEPKKMIIQSVSFSPSTLKNCCKPGTSTIAI